MSTTTLSRRITAMHPKDAALAFEDAPYARHYRRRWWPEFGRETDRLCRRSTEYKTAGSFGTAIQEFVPEDACLPSLTIYTRQSAAELGKMIAFATGVLVLVPGQRSSYEVCVDAGAVTETHARALLSTLAGVERHKIVFRIGAIGI